ncbi:hypothetical protein GBA52_004366 [Prunus armeniaca]|nr:hypothetical protein GBA52_004366 [Prunus armeniaca]
MSLTIFTLLLLSFTLSSYASSVNSQSEVEVKQIYQEWLVKHQKTYNEIERKTRGSRSSRTT